MDHVKEMAKVFESYRYKHGVHRVFEDFLELAAITISNAVDRPNWQRRESRYMQIIKQYDKEEANTFAKLIAMLTNAMQSRTDDYLGRVFMELELYDSFKGQFFTPISVADLMAKMVAVDAKERIRTQGFIRVNEPAAGGGVTLLAFINKLQANGCNTQKTVQVFAQDLDKKAVHMTYIQLSLLGINLTITHGDTLTQEVWDTWRSPGYFFRWGYGDPNKRESSFAKVAENEKLQEVAGKLEELPIDGIGQLSFF